MRTRCFIAALFVITMLLPLSATHAATIEVNTQEDYLNPDTKCTLRKAISAMNDRGAIAGCTNTGENYGTNDTIILPAGHYVLTQAGTAEDFNARGDLDLWRTDLTVTISGAGARGTVINGAGIDRVFDIHDGVTATIKDVTILGGKVNDPNGYGGGIYSHNATLTLSDSIVKDNATAGATSGGGGGLFIFGNHNGVPSKIVRSVISGNAGYRGGGIMLATTQPEPSRTEIINSTISGNSAMRAGGGVAVSGAGVTLDLFNVTIVGNTTSDSSDMGSGGGGGIICSPFDSTITIANSVVAGNTDSKTPSSPDCVGPLTSNGYTILGNDTNCGFTGTDGTNGDQVGVAVATVLNPTLANNGGPTPTLALVEGSPAIDAGNPSGCTKTDGKDQRGFTRPYNERCDIGAFEFQPISAETSEGIAAEEAAAEGTPEAVAPVEGDVTPAAGGGGCSLMR